MALGVALAADIAGPRQVRQHLRKAHRQLPFQPARLLRPRLSLAWPPPLAPLRLRCFGFGAGFSRASIAVASREMCS